jgi:AcrR family transcriptional regulator
MTGGGDSPRAYESPRRREQAAQTRARILDSARRLFELHGYTATSMRAIASDAGVASKTVYVAFETKATLLRALWHLALRGDEDSAPVGSRTWFTDVLDEPDPVRQLELNARNSRVVKERVGALMDVLRTAAVADPDIAELWDRIQREFYDNQRTVVRSLQRKKALKAGLGVARASDILWTLNHPDVYRLLVGDRTWTAAHYEEWLARSLVEQLLSRPE